MSSLSLKDYQEDRKERGVYDKRNPLNNLTGKEWLFSTKTIIPKSYSSILSTQLIPPNYNFIPVQLCAEILDTYSKPNSTILDPFAGIGTTVIGNFFTDKESSSSKRNFLGIQPNQLFHLIFQKLVLDLKLKHDEMLIGNPLTCLSEIQEESVDLIFTDLPIWNISNFNNNDRYSFSLEVFNKSPKQTLQNWVNAVSKVLFQATSKLKKSKYMVIALGDYPPLNNPNGDQYPQINFVLSSLLTHNLQKKDIVLKAERIWFLSAKNTNLTDLRALQRRFLVFRKENRRSDESSSQEYLFNDRFPIGKTQILHKSFPPSFDHKLRSQHGGMKPPELADFLIQKFTNNPNDLILDPFAGVGGTLLGASLANRRAIGIDINEKWKQIYLQVSQNAHFSPHEFLIGDSRKIINSSIGDKTIDFVLTDVPYWAMDKLTKTRGRYSKAGEVSREKLPTPLKEFNSSSILTIHQWIDLLRDVFSLVYPKLRNKKYLVIFIGNMYRTIREKQNGKIARVGKYLMLSSTLARILLDLGYNFEKEIIWYSPDKALHVFGYPFAYIPSIVHQSILVFKK